MQPQGEQELFNMFASYSVASISPVGQVSEFQVFIWQ